MSRPVVDYEDFYHWKAVLVDGSEMTQGGDLRSARAFVLEPTRPRLPKHTITGVSLISRFCRLRFDAKMGSKDKWRILNHISSIVHANRLTKLRDIYRESLPGLEQMELAGDERLVMQCCSEVRKAYEKSRKRQIVWRDPTGGVDIVKGEVLHCIQADVCRFWVRYSTGDMVVTTPDYELRS